MGNGAGILEGEEEEEQRLVPGSSRTSHLDYDDIERKVRSDYYVKQFNRVNGLESGDNATRDGNRILASSEYEQVLNRAISAEALDVLEALVKVAFFRGGSSSSSSSRGKTNAPLVLPLHFAARMGKVEACELLCSAGYDLLARDAEHGQTPLHKTGFSSSLESALCAAFMANAAGLRLVGSKAANGYTILHICCSANNLPVLHAVLSYVFDSRTPGGSSEEVKRIISSRNSKGETALDIAKRNSYSKLYDCFDANSAVFTGAVTSLACRAEVAVDTDRVMRVWEAFFENAAAFKEQSRLARRAEDKSPPRVLTIQPTAVASPAPAASSSQVKDDWFDWLLLSYDNDNGLGDKDYYLIHEATYESRSLKTHLQRMGFDYNSRGSAADYAAPLSVDGCAADGWLRYYDDSYNYCYFMNIVSGKLEYCLPLSQDVRGIRRFGLQSSAVDGEWLYCEQAALCRDWIVVDDGEDADPYYWNRSTGHTTRTTPHSYDAVVESNGGWALFCSAASGHVPYWSHLASGESRWETD